jgi:Thioredoxin-like
MRSLCVFVIILVISTSAPAQRVDQLVPPALMPALQQWQRAVLSGDKAALKALYDPAPQLQDIKKQSISLADELQFWTADQKAGHRTMKVDIVKIDPPQNGTQSVKFQMELKGGGKTRYVVAVQGWKVGSSPRIVAETRTAMLRLKQPVKLNPKLYDPAEDAKAEIREAEQRAAREHKRVLLIFGGNWCYDCHVLDLAFHSGDIEPTLVHNYLTVHVDVGEYNKNLDLAEKYQVPLQKGVPAIAVVDPADKLIFSQQAGEFEQARSMSPEQILAFLDKWKPPARPR